MTIANYLGVNPQSLLSSSDAPESIQKNRVGSSVTEPLLKTIEAQDKVIAVQEELLKHLEKQIKNLEEAKTESKERRTKRQGQTKNPTKPKKRKVEFLKKHKKPKSWYYVLHTICTLFLCLVWLLKHCKIGRSEYLLSASHAGNRGVYHFLGGLRFLKNPTFC